MFYFLITAITILELLRRCSYVCTHQPWGEVGDPPIVTTLVPHCAVYNICVYIVVPPGNIIMLSNYADDDSIETGRNEELEFGRVPLKCQRAVYYYYHGCVLIELCQFFARVLCINI